MVGGKLFEGLLCFLFFSLCVHVNMMKLIYVYKYILFKKYQSLDLLVANLLSFIFFSLFLFSFVPGFPLRETNEFNDKRITNFR